jgi:hypothetical protein
MDTLSSTMLRNEDETLIFHPLMRRNEALSSASSPMGAGSATIRQYTRLVGNWIARDSQTARHRSE